MAADAAEALAVPAAVPTDMAEEQELPADDEDDDLAKNEGLTLTSFHFNTSQERSRKRREIHGCAGWQWQEKVGERTP